MVALPFTSKAKPTTLIHVKSIHEKDLVDTAWKAIGNGQQLSWKLSATAKISAKVAKDCRKTIKEIRENLKLDSKNAVAPAAASAGGISGLSDGIEDVLGIAGAEIASFGAELGLDMPVLRQAMAVVRLGISVGKVAKTSYDLKQFYSAYKGVEAVAITSLANKALKTILQKELAERSISLGTCTLDLVVSFADPTSVSSGGFKSTAKLAFRLVQLYRSYKLVREVNEILRERSKFDVSIFGRMPLLGCYLFSNVETSLLLGTFYDLQDDADPAIRALVTHGNLTGADKLKIEQLYKTHLGPLETLALARIKNAPYQLMAAGNH